jgi:hypothetical protein
MSEEQKDDALIFFHLIGFFILLAILVWQSQR